MGAALRLHEADTVAVALMALAPGDATGIDQIVAREVVPRGHKVALRDIAAREAVVKLGHTIGIAAEPIAAGTHVHTHNLRFAPVAEAHGALRNIERRLPEPTGATFQGYRRADGRVGTRNMLLVLSTVNCSATVVRRIAERFRASVDLVGTGIDGVAGLTHREGCSVRADGPGMEILRRTLAGYARHPNVGGVLVVGLGCEDNNVNDFFASAGLHTSDRLVARVIQQEGGSEATVASCSIGNSDWLMTRPCSRTLRSSNSWLSS
jgi:altronate hydrolase